MYHIHKKINRTISTNLTQQYFIVLLAQIQVGL